MSRNRVIRPRDAPGPLIRLHSAARRAKTGPRRMNQKELKQVLRTRNQTRTDARTKTLKRLWKKSSFSSEQRARRPRRDPGGLGTCPEIAFSAPGAAGNAKSTPESSFSTPPLYPSIQGEANSTGGASAASPNSNAVLAQASHRIQSTRARARRPGKAQWLDSELTRGAGRSW